MSFPNWNEYAAVILGTGPSMHAQVFESLERLRQSFPVKVFTMNNSYFAAEHSDLHFANNWQWWDYYCRTTHLAEDIRDEPNKFWTWHEPTASKWGASYIEGRWSGGPRNVTSLSTDPSYIHYGHGSGYEILGIAYHCGIRRFALFGYDMSYPPKYNPARKDAGGDRHYFGEYPRELQHWPSVSVGGDGTLRGLLELYETIDLKTLGLSIINCTPNSKLTRFPYVPMGEVLKYGIH